jgi:hypothetical protein
MKRIGIKGPGGQQQTKRPGVRKPPAVSGGPTGEAIAQNRATRFDINKSPLTTGNVNYKPPGCEDGMS